MEENIVIGIAKFNKTIAVYRLMYETAGWIFRDTETILHGYSGHYPTQEDAINAFKQGNHKVVYITV